MNQQQFKAAPHLLMRRHLVELGYGKTTIHKFEDCGVLRQVRPPGADQVRYQKKQLAQLLKWDGLLGAEAFAREKPLMELKVVKEWTGMSEVTLNHVVQAGGLSLVRPAGMTRGKFLKSEIAELLGFEHLV